MEFNLIYIPENVAPKIGDDIQQVLRGNISKYISLRLGEVSNTNSDFADFVLNKFRGVSDRQAFLHGAFLIHDGFEEAKKYDAVKQPIDKIEITDSDLVQHFMQKHPMIFKDSKRFFGLLCEQGEKYQKLSVSSYLYWIGIVEAVKQLNPQKDPQLF